MSRVPRLWPAISLLAVIHLPIVFAPWIAPYNFDTQERFHPFAPPTRLHFFDSAGVFHLRPFTYESHLRSGTLNEYEEDTSRRYVLQFFVEDGPSQKAGEGHSGFHFFGVEQPAHLYLLGSD